jgi:hypothetical protein
MMAISIRRMLLSVIIGFLVAVLAMGLLPFLVVFSFAEIYGEIDAAALPFMFIHNWLDSEKANGAHAGEDAKEEDDPSSKPT